MGHSKEDWERVHLTDSVYVKEMEYLEKEHFNYGEKPPAKIICETLVKSGKNERSRQSNRTYKAKVKALKRVKRKLTF